MHDMYFSAQVENFGMKFSNIVKYYIFFYVHLFKLLRENDIPNIYPNIKN